ncbi:MAG: DUF885 domain-containing protein, partial [Gemmatimonadales bacterium]
MRRYVTMLMALAVIAGCATPDDAADPVAEALAIADEWVAGYYNEYPEDAYETGYPAPLDRMGDHSLANIAAYQAREDAWVARLQAIDVAALEGTSAAVPYTFSLERLQASIARRVCQTHLWNASPTWTGWQNFFGGVFAKQPVGTEESRSNTIARARDVDRYIDTEIDNLRAGMREGFTAPRSNVLIVISQIEALMSVSAEESPFYEPALRDGDPVFAADLAAVISEEIMPAAQRYRDFLNDEYLATARESIGVTTDPGGRDCYLASVNYHVTLPLKPEEIHSNGLREMERIHAEMRDIGRRSFGTDDVPTLLRMVKADPANSFETPEAIVAFAQEAVDRAKAAMPDWFGFVPQAEVALKPYPDYMQTTGGGFYSAGAADGST